MKENQFPLVSAIIPFYNRADLVSKAIESALAQDYPNLEIIVSDNCSTDHADSVVKKYLSDKRIRYSRNETNIGMLPNFRKAAYELAKGGLFSFIASDDKLIDNRFISESVRLINNHEDIVLVFARNQMINKQGRIINTCPEHPYFVKEFWNGRDVFFKAPEYGFLSWGGCMIKKDVLYAVKGLQSDCIFADMECNYKIMLSGNVGFINRICYESLSHSDNASDTRKAEDKISQLRCLNDICEYAKNILPAEAGRIDQWNGHFVYALGYNYLKMLKENNQKEFIRFKEYFIKTYPAKYKSIKAKWKYMLFMIFYSIKNKIKIN